MVVSLMMRETLKLSAFKLGENFILGLTAQNFADGRDPRRRPKRSESPDIAAAAIDVPSKTSEVFRSALFRSPSMNLTNDDSSVSIAVKTARSSPMRLGVSPRRKHTCRRLMSELSTALVSTSLVGVAPASTRSLANIYIFLPPWKLVDSIISNGVLALFSTTTSRILLMIPYLVLENGETVHGSTKASIFAPAEMSELATSPLNVMQAT